MARACSAGLAARASWRRANTRLSAGGSSSNRIFWARSPGLTWNRAYSRLVALRATSTVLSNPVLVDRPQPAELAVRGRQQRVEDVQPQVLLVGCHDTFLHPSWVVKKPVRVAQADRNG